MTSMPDPPHPLPLSATDFHVLLVLAEKPLWGYAIMRAVEDESGGMIRPDVGSLYRILARLMESGLLEETPAPREADGAAHRGRPRRYYRITLAGLRAVRSEALRLAGVLEVARSRSLLPEGRS